MFIHLIILYLKSDTYEISDKLKYIGYAELSKLSEF